MPEKNQIKFDDDGTPLIFYNNCPVFDDERGNTIVDLTALEIPYDMWDTGGKIEKTFFFNEEIGEWEEEPSIN